MLLTSLAPHVQDAPHSGEALSESLSGHMPSSWEAELRGLRGGASARDLEGTFPGFGTCIELSLEML